MKFSELNKTKKIGVVMVALEFEEDQKDDVIKQMNEVFTETGLLTDGTKVINIEKIEGNVLGSKSRTDVFIELDKFGVSPMVRIMKWRDVKWVEDFVVNYANDYVA